MRSVKGQQVAGAQAGARDVAQDVAKAQLAVAGWIIGAARRPMGDGMSPVDGQPTRDMSAAQGPQVAAEGAGVEGLLL